MTRCEFCGKEIPPEDELTVIVSVSDMAPNDCSTRGKFFEMLRLCDDCERRLVKTDLPGIIRRKGDER